MKHSLQYCRPKAVIADGDVTILRFVTRMLAEKFSMTRICNDGKAAIDAVVREQPQLLILDIFLPLLDGIQVVRRINSLGIDCKTVMLTGFEADRFVDAALDAGAKGFVFKRRKATDLLRALDIVLRGGVFISSGARDRAQRTIPNG
jgi:DNA-binding NarL/FixJ family response regulator